MSKKSSTFVSDFNSEIYNTLKYQRVMKNECIFRCQRNGKTYRVVAIPNEHASRGVMYFAYIGRRRLEHIGWYNQEYAIDSVLCDALGQNLWEEVKGAL